MARWPCSVKRYPEQDEPNSWWSVKDFAINTGHDITLAGRKTEKHPHRVSKLTIRGPNVREVFKEVCRMTRAAGICTDDVRVVFGAASEDLTASHWDKEQVSVIEESADKPAVLEVEDEQQDCLVPCIWGTTLGGAPWGPMKPDGSHRDGTPWGSMGPHGAIWGKEARFILQPILECSLPRSITHGRLHQNNPDSNVVSPALSPGAMVSVVASMWQCYTTRT